MSPVVGLVLAGGQGRRMGGADKALLPLAGRPLVDHVVARLRPQCAALLLNANGDPTRFAPWGLDVVPDGSAAPLGPLAGVLAGLRWLERHRPDAGWLLTAPCDTPLLPAELVRQLAAAQAASGARIVRAASGGRAHGVVALWSVALADELALGLAEGPLAVDPWSRARGAVDVAFRVAPFDPFLNVNTPADLTRAATLLAAPP